MSVVGYVVKTMTLTIKVGAGSAVSYECAITGVQEQESHDSVTTQVACPDGSATDVGPSTYELVIGYQVSNVAASLHRLLREQAGKAATVTIEPAPVAEPGIKITYQVVLVSGGADYTVGGWANASVTLPVIGVPVTAP